nr:uncharacterized protein LOC123762223 [Procambarus clarkii]
MEYPYLKNETLYLSMGGETCANNPPRSSCPTALQEMAELHYRFLNVDYIQVVLDAWRTQGCFNTIWSSMGYNFVGVQAQFPAEVAVGCQLKVGILIANKGWAAPINYRSAQVSKTVLMVYLMSHFPIQVTGYFYSILSSQTCFQHKYQCSLPSLHI